MTEAGKGTTKIEIGTLVEVMDAEEGTEVIIVTNREEGIVARAVPEEIEMTDEYQVCSPVFALCLVF